MRAYSIFTIPAGLSDEQRRQRKHMLARLGLAWLAMMQVMMFAFPGYLRSETMEPDSLALMDKAIFIMNWAALLLTVPVMMYCAQPIWTGAWNSLKNFKVGMDVPVALGIVVAFIPSVVSTWQGQGEVYFDSVSMFVAFLLTARYLEFCARQSISRGQSFDRVEQFRAGISVRANTLAFWFVLIQVILALVLGVVWFFYQPEHAVAVMVALFVMSCPCAMSMSVPTAVAAAQAGLMVHPAQSEADISALIQRTEHISKQNLYGSIVWHLLMTPLAAVGLVSPWVAAVSMLLSSLLVALNSWRIYRQRISGNHLSGSEAAA
ncbi:MAG: P-type ATPase [Paenalcaligenes sp.]